VLLELNPGSAPVPTNHLVQYLLTIGKEMLNNVINPVTKNIWSEGWLSLTNLTLDGSWAEEWKRFLVFFQGKKGKFYFKKKEKFHSA